MPWDVEFSSGASRQCWSSGSIVVTVDVRSFLRPFQGRRLWAARHFLQHALVNRINRCQSCLKFCHKLFDSPRRDCVNVTLLVLPQQTFHLNEIGRQRRIRSRSSTSNSPTWISRLSKGRTSSHRKMELYRDETATAGPLQQAHLQTSR